MEPNRAYFLSHGRCMKVHYKNHRGEEAEREIFVNGSPYWGSTEWHPEPQWFIQVWDYDRKAYRDFAMKDMRPVTE